MVRFYLIITLLAFLPFIPVRGAEPRHLFLITQNGKTGFIDVAGTVVIRPQYDAANDFSEGLAAVRIGGLYGFANESGQMVIAPKYEYATAFHEGLALVYENARPYFINRNSEKAFDNSFPDVGSYCNGRAKVATGLHEGYIDKTGALVIDTAFRYIMPFTHGYATVMNNTNGYSVIDTNGHMLVPFGRYFRVGDYSEGCFWALKAMSADEAKRNVPSTFTYFDTSGTEVFSISDSLHCPQAYNFSCGLAIVSIIKYKDADPSRSSPFIKRYSTGFINKEGRLVMTSDDWSMSQGFSHNRCFIRGCDQYYSLMDTKGTIIATKAYTGAGQWTADGLASVRVNDKWGIIDTNGKTVLRPVFDEIDDIGSGGDSFILFRARQGKDQLTPIGIASFKGTVLLPPTLDYIDRHGFRNGLAYCLIAGRPAWVNTHGRVVWRQAATHEDVDIDYMEVAGFAARSSNEPPVTDDPYRSQPAEVKESMEFPRNQLSVVARPSEKDTSIRGINGTRFYVANTGNSAAYFGADNTRLEMVMQAQDAHGEWRDIQYLVGSGCGNAYHIVTLGPGKYWSFVAPLYKGGVATKLRVALTCKRDAEVNYFDYGKNNYTIYSNAYDGNINPAQFWRKKKSRQKMDPYRDSSFGY